MKRLAALTLLLLAAACTAPPPARSLSADGLEEESPRPSRRKAPAQADLSSLPALSLDGLAPAEETAEETPRNLFTFEEDPAVVAERKRKADEAAQKAREAAEKAAWIKAHTYGPPPPPPPPQPPPIPFHFVGYFGRPDDRVGVFTGGSGMVLAQKGDQIFGSFKVVDIGYESAEIGFQGFTETQRIPLTGGK
jgi:hypothetical protein